MGGSDQADPPPVPGGLEHRQVRGPGHQVAGLHQVDLAAVPVRRAGQLGRALLRGRGPDLVGDEDLAAVTVQRAGEQLLGGAVHGRGVEQADAGRDGGLGRLPRPCGGRSGCRGGHRAPHVPMLSW